MSSANPSKLVEANASNAGMLLAAQRTIDDALELAALVVGRADGRPLDRVVENVDGRIAAIARGLMARRDSVALASYLTDPALDDERKGTRAGLLRVVSGYFDGPPTNGTVAIVADPNGEGYGFETPDGEAYGAATLEETIDIARNMGLDYEVEK